MAVDLPPQKKTRINIDKVQEFFETNEISVECPICKSILWDIPDAESTGGNALPYGSGKGAMFMSGFPVLILICRKCKFVRLQSLFGNDMPGVVEEY